MILLPLLPSPSMIKSPNKFQLYLQLTFTIYFHYHHSTLSLTISLPWITIIKSSLFNLTYSWTSLTHSNLYFAWSFSSQGIWLFLAQDTILTSTLKQKGREDKFQKFYYVKVKFGNKSYDSSQHFGDPNETVVFPLTYLKHC